MLDNIFGDTFDFNRDGEMDSFERRAAHTAFLDEIRMQEGIDKPLRDMTADEIDRLASISGIDFGETGL